MSQNRVSRRAPGYLGWLLLLLIVFLTGSARWRLLDVPLERDEGEYAYAGQLMLQGIPPYEHAYNTKLPGIYGAYAAVLAVFGETHRAIHLGLLVVNGVTIVLLFLLARHFMDDLSAVAAAARTLRDLCGGRGIGPAAPSDEHRWRHATYPKWTASGPGLRDEATRSSICHVRVCVLAHRTMQELPSGVEANRRAPCSLWGGRSNPVPGPLCPRVGNSFPGPVSPS